LAKNSNGDLVADFHNIKNSWKNYFSQKLNVQTVSNARQMEILTAESLFSEPSTLDVEFEEV
jgi:hypothetical protein